MSSGDTVLVADKRLKNEDVKVEVASCENGRIVEDLRFVCFVGWLVWLGFEAMGDMKRMFQMN